MKKFTIKDVTFLAIMSVVLLLASGLVMPIVMFTQIFAFRQVFGSLFFGGFTIIALHRIPKLGTITIIGIITGVFLGFMSTIMLVNQIVGAIITEVIIFIVFRSYDSLKARFVGAAIYVPMTLPVTLVTTHIMRGTPFSQILGSPGITLLMILGTLLVSCLSVYVGQKISLELKKAGKLSW